MSKKYSSWINKYFRGSDYSKPNSSPDTPLAETKEQLYQEFKNRLIEEILVDSVHLPQYATLKDATK